MNPKSLLLSCVATLLLISCKTNSIVKTNNTPDWIWGKTFTTTYIPFINSEIGGADFISFENKNQINLKMGCTLSKVKGEFNVDTISIEDLFLKTKKTFTIFNNSLLIDEYGTEWKLKTIDTTPFDITNLNWKIVTLNNQPVHNKTTDFYLKLDPSNGRFESKAGCNQILGEFKIKDNHIEFSKITSTKMFCLDESKTENEYIKILNSIDNFVVTNNTTLILKKESLSQIKFILIQ